MSPSMKKINQWITTIAGFIQQDQDIPTDCYGNFMDSPELAIQIIDVIEGLDERRVDANPSRYTACIFVLDICVAKLQTASESSSKLAHKTLNQLMSRLAQVICGGKHSLSFWLPILNAFYEVHTELSVELKDAYLTLANQESIETLDDEVTHLSSIRDLITELSDLSVFDIAENFFAQSYAMPADFFIDLVLDLYHIEEGHDIALLTLLHPNREVRDVVVSTLDSLMPSITLSSISLSRLQMIKHWYPQEYHAQFNQWITLQRKKGVVFHRGQPAKIVQLKASEVDGGGAQGVFIHIRKKKQNRLCGLLLKSHLGIKDAWITPEITEKDVKRYYEEAFDDSIVLRSIDMPYLTMITNHFLHVTLAQDAMPDLHFLEIQEELGLQFLPNALDVADLMQQVGIQISPFTTETMQASLLRSKKWPKTKYFVESWFVENAMVDKLVTQCSGFLDGQKICDLEQAVARVFQEELELHRDQWLFHFLWVTLWMKAGARPSELMWKDSFIIAHLIQSGEPLTDIPLMHMICHKSVLNSIDTMHERRTHLS
ncbi:MAG: hypothetical protein CK424_05865 [Legionella sp.]|nr:MAG: hypothetical protein CK424_05865 [Legionella sp.]